MIAGCYAITGAQHSQIFASKQMQKYKPGFRESSTDILLWSQTAVLKTDKVRDFEMTCGKPCLLKLHQIPLQLIKRNLKTFLGPHAVLCDIAKYK